MTAPDHIYLAPNRIYVDPWIVVEVVTQGDANAVEYVRADLTIREALERILADRGAVFDAMVDAAEDAAGKDVSFNVVVGRAIRAAIFALIPTKGADQ